MLKLGGGRADRPQMGNGRRVRAGVLSVAALVASLAACPSPASANGGLAGTAPTGPAPTGPPRTTTPAASLGKPDPATPQSLSRQLKLAKSAQAGAQRSVNEADAHIGQLTKQVAALESDVSNLGVAERGEYDHYVSARARLNKMAIADYVGGGSQLSDLDFGSSFASIAEAARTRIYADAVARAKAQAVDDFDSARRRLIGATGTAVTQLSQLRSDLVLATADRVRRADDVAAKAGDVVQLNLLVHLATATAPVPPSDIPLLFVDAYQRAARAMSKQSPACKLRWTSVAAIGKIESGHGTFGGATLAINGDVSPILGPALDGTNGFALILDTDKGLLDTDPVYDRAVGPMQFIPSTWHGAGRDGNGDKVANPSNAYDAALAAAAYLCRAVPAGGLDTEPGLQQAYFSYNHSDAYVAAVLAQTYAYDAMAIGPVRPVTAQ